MTNPAEEATPGEALLNALNDQSTMERIADKASEAQSRILSEGSTPKLHHPLMVDGVIHNAQCAVFFTKPLSVQRNICSCGAKIVFLEKNLAEANAFDDGWNAAERGQPRDESRSVKWLTGWEYWHDLEKLESTRTALRNLIDEVKWQFENALPAGINYRISLGEEALSGKTEAKPAAVPEVVVRAIRRARTAMSMWQNGYAFDEHGVSRHIQEEIDAADALLAAAPEAQPVPAPKDDGGRG